MFVLAIIGVLIVPCSRLTWFAFISLDVFRVKSRCESEHAFLKELVVAWTHRWHSNVDQPNSIVGFDVEVGTSVYTLIRSHPHYRH